MSLYYIRSNFLLHQKPTTKNPKKKPKKKTNKTFDWSPVLLKSFDFLVLWYFGFFGFLVSWFFGILVFWCFSFWIYSSLSHNFYLV